VTLLSLIMADELERFAEMSDTIEVARRMPVTVDRESADSWGLLGVGRHQRAPVDWKA